MSRERNRELGVFKDWEEDNELCLLVPEESVELLDESRVHLIFDVKVQTNMHLALKSIDDRDKDSPDAQKIYPMKQLTDQVHFMRMEGVLFIGPGPNDIWSWWEAAKGLWMWHDPQRPVIEWKLVDFDNCLEGNPHYQSTAMK